MPDILHKQLDQCVPSWDDLSVFQESLGLQGVWQGRADYLWCVLLNDKESVLSPSREDTYTIAPLISSTTFCEKKRSKTKERNKDEEWERNWLQDLLFLFMKFGHRLHVQAFFGSNVIRKINLGRPTSKPEKKKKRKKRKKRMMNYFNYGVYCVFDSRDTAGTNIKIAIPFSPLLVDYWQWSVLHRSLLWLSPIQHWSCPVVLHWPGEREEGGKMKGDIGGGNEMRRRYVPTREMRNMREREGGEERERDWSKFY